jgi:hypothetical protein
MLDPRRLAKPSEILTLESLQKAAKDLQREYKGHEELAPFAAFADLLVRYIEGAAKAFESHRHQLSWYKNADHTEGPTDDTGTSVSFNDPEPTRRIRSELSNARKDED